MSVFARYHQLYYGWIMVTTLAITETVSWGIVYYSFSVFITPLEGQFHWSRAQISGAFSLALLTAGFMALPVGYLLDRHGPRLLMTTGSGLAALMIFLLSRVHTLTEFYIVWAILGATQAMVLYEPAFVLIANWFVVKRGTALAILTFTAGFASTIFLPLIDALIHQMGWRSALVVLSLLLGGITIPLHALVLRRHPRDLGLKADGRKVVVVQDEIPVVDDDDMSASLGDVMRTRTFWLLTLSFALAGFSAASIRIHFIPYLIGQGFGASFAAWVAGFIGAAQVLGRVIFAPLERRFPTITITPLLFALQGVAIGLLLFTTTFSALAFVVVFGAAYGAMTLARPLLLSQMYGSLQYGRINSLTVFAFAMAVTAGPLSAGLVYGHFGNYKPLLFLLIVVYASATVVIRLASRSQQHT